MKRFLYGSMTAFVAMLMLFGVVISACSTDDDDDDNKKIAMLMMAQNNKKKQQSNNNNNNNDNTNTNITGAVDWQLPAAAPATGAVTLFDSSNNAKSFDTIQDALTACKNGGKFTITLEPGLYTIDSGLVYNGSAGIRIIGKGSATYGTDVVIYGHGGNMGAMGRGTAPGREILEVAGTGNLTLENLSLVSDYKRSEHGGNDVQAEVLGFNSTGLVTCYNCSFSSWQDTIRTTGKGWFYKCYIDGDVDFIWMENRDDAKVALYESCVIVEKTAEKAPYIAAPKLSKASKIGKGVVIWKSKIIVDGTANPAYLFRNPWGGTCDGYNQVAYVGCDIQGIDPTVVKAEQVVVPADSTSIGWFIDETLAALYPNKSPTVKVLSAQTVTAEYSTRAAILDNFCLIDGGYAQGASHANITAQVAAWEAGNSLGVPTKAGDIDPNATYIQSYAMADLKGDAADAAAVADGATTDGKMSWTGMKYNSAKYGFQTSSTSTLTLKLDKPVIVSMTGSQYSNGTVTAKVGDTTLVNAQATKVPADGNKLQLIINVTQASDVVLSFTADTYIADVSILDYNGEDPEVKSVVISGGKSIPLGNTSQLTANVVTTLGMDNSVEWASDTPAVATVDATGLVTSVAVGTAKITCTSKGDSAQKDTVTVKVFDDAMYTFFAPSATSISYTGTASNNANTKATVSDATISFVTPIVADSTKPASLSNGVITVMTTADAANKTASGGAMLEIKTTVTPVASPCKITGVSISNLDQSGTGNARAVLYVGEKQIELTDNDGTVSGKTINFMKEMSETITGATEVKLQLAAKEGNQIGGKAFAIKICNFAIMFEK